MVSVSKRGSPSHTRCGCAAAVLDVVHDSSREKPSATLMVVLQYPDAPDDAFSTSLVTIVYIENDFALGLGKGGLHSNY
ncbi:hypothetical protein CERZMDRAFT_89532 [Cercospora zeae-maydis SCOH1-5]|uniref:Uncharacterized protein n=1 Tax=Cercospora zeae-maydis SCOH1-5 TaxID=717836 RepID=A0A6A6FVE6_9PEZI|nr:hypothetical protein CERZMDRAFT_89532 [Cercospora zeae-maydis SCOH1-5]